MEVEDTKGNMVEVKPRSKKKEVMEIDVRKKKEKKVKEVKVEVKENPTLEHLFMAILFRLDVIEKLLK